MDFLEAFNFAKIVYGKKLVKFAYFLLWIVIWRIFFMFLKLMWNDQVLFLLVKNWLDK